MAKTADRPQEGSPRISHEAAKVLIEKCVVLSMQLDEAEKLRVARRASQGPRGKSMLVMSRTSGGIRRISRIPGGGGRAAEPKTQVTCRRGLARERSTMAKHLLLNDAPLSVGPPRLLSSVLSGSGGAPGLSEELAHLQGVSRLGIPQGACHCCLKFAALCVLDL